MIYVIDTNIFIRILVREDEKSFQECEVFLQMVQEGKIEVVIPGIILSEIVWLLTSFYKREKTVVVQSVRGILALSGCEVVDQYDYNKVLSIYKKYSVKYIDACLASIPKVAAREWSIVSYDRDFAKLPVLWQTPDQVLKNIK